MAQDLRRFDAWVTESEWPHVACPVCADGFLAIEVIEPTQDAESHRVRDHPDWDPDWITGTFRGLLKCAQKDCQTIVTIAGEMKVDVVTSVSGAWHGEYGEYYRLRFALPALQLMVPVVGTPDEVTEAVRQAAAVLWTDPSAAANRLRVAIEALLTARGVRRFVTRNGHRSALTTHTRIVEFKAKKPEAGDALEAVKWIGNAGSHDDQLTISQVIEGADMLHFALRLLYDTHDKDLVRRIKAVNKAKGMPSK